MTERRVEGARAVPGSVPGQEAPFAACVRGLGLGRMRHAQLVLAPDPALAHDFLQAVAAAAFCVQRQGDAWPCGSCPGCRVVARRRHPDLHWWGREGKLGIDQVRELSAVARLRPALGLASVFVLEAAERLTGPAAGAMLKTLEDPPGAALFLLSALHPDDMESTLRSRCLPLWLRPLSPAQAAGWARARYPALGEGEALALGAGCGGWPGLALDALEDRVEAGGVGEALLAGLTAGGVPEAISAGAELAARNVSPYEALALLRDAWAHGRGVAASGRGLAGHGVPGLWRAWSGRDLGRACWLCLEAADAARAHVTPSLNWGVLLLRLRALRLAC